MKTKTTTKRAWRTTRRRTFRTWMRWMMMQVRSPLHILVFSSASCVAFPPTIFPSSFTYMTFLPTLSFPQYSISWYNPSSTRTLHFFFAPLRTSLLSLPFPSFPFRFPYLHSTDAAESHTAALAALSKTDPEFFAYLQENDKELLEFGMDVDDDGEDEDGGACVPFFFLFLFALLAMFLSALL